jgi:hypothetical protein
MFCSWVFVTSINVYQIRPFWCLMVIVEKSDKNFAYFDLSPEVPTVCL